MNLRFSWNYDSSSIDMELLSYLRNLDMIDFRRSRADEEKSHCLNLLNRIIDKFNVDYRADIFYKIISNIPTSNCEDWQTNCYTLSIAFLAKSNEASVAERMLNSVLQSFDLVNQYSNDNQALLTIVEIFLFALCNITKVNDCTFDSDAASKLIPYYKQDQNKIIKLLSAYLLVYLFNRNNTTMVELDDVQCIVEYLNAMFVEVEYNHSVQLMGFVCGQSEMREVDNALMKLETDYNFNPSNYRRFLTKYRQSMIDEPLMSYLRCLDPSTYLFTLSDKEREECHHLLMEIVKHFHHKYKEHIFHKIIINGQLNDKELWMTNCYTLSVTFLAKVDGGVSSDLLLYVAELGAEFVDKTTKNQLCLTMTEICLFAMCNISRNKMITFDEDTQLKLTTCLNTGLKHIMQVLSAYLLLVIFNRQTISIYYDNMGRVLEYMTDVKRSIKQRNSTSYNGFICGKTELEEIYEAFTKYGWTELHHACSDGDEDMVTVLLDRGLEVDSKDEYEHTALLLAISNGHTEIVRILLDRGSNIESSCKDGQTPLHHACIYGYTDIVELLLDRGSNMEYMDSDGRTGLHIACRRGYVDIINILLDRGSNIDCSDNNGRTGLHQACTTCLPDIVEILLNRGSNIMKKANNGQSPWDIASNTTDRRCFHVLCSAVQKATENGHITDGGWNISDYRLIRSIGECDKDVSENLVGRTVEIFNDKYKPGILKNIIDESPLQNSHRISVNCLATALQLNLKFHDQCQIRILSLLEEFYPHRKCCVIITRIIEVIMYSICWNGLYTHITNNALNIILEMGLSEDTTNSIQMASSVILCYTTNSVAISPVNTGKVVSYLSSVLNRMRLRETGEYLGFSRDQIINALSQIDSPDEEDNGIMELCMDMIGWQFSSENSENSLKEWIMYITKNVPQNKLLGLVLEKLFGVMKSTRKEGYWRDVIVVFVYVRIFSVPHIIGDPCTTLTNEDKGHFQHLMMLLYDKYGQISNEHRHPLLECMMDFIKDMANDLCPNKSLQTLLEAVLSFVAYYSIIDDYKYKRGVTFVESFLRDDIYVDIWPSVIMCLCTGELKHAYRLREYLDTQLMDEDDVTKDMAVVYVALIRCLVNNGTFINEDLLRPDYRLILTINECGILTMDNITSFNDNIIDLFNQKNRPELMKTLKNDIAMTETEKSLINCLAISLQCCSICDGNIFDTMLSLLQELYPILVTNFTAMRISEIILYNMCSNQLYNHDMINLCRKYWSNNTMSDEIRLSSSMLLCHTIVDIESHSNIILSHIIDTTNIIHVGCGIKPSKYLGFSCEEIMEAVAKMNTRVHICWNEKIGRMADSDEYWRIIEEMDKMFAMTGTTICCVRVPYGNVSPYFYSHKNGYLLRLELEIDYKRICIRIYIHPGSYDQELRWPCKHSFTISVINQLSGEMHCSRTISGDPRYYRDGHLHGRPSNVNGTSVRYGSVDIISWHDFVSIAGLRVNGDVIIRCDTIL